MIRRFGPRGALLGRRVFFGLKGIEADNLRQHCEVVGRRCRRGRPFEGTAIPWIAGWIREHLAMSDTVVKLRDQESGANRDQNGTAGRREQPGLPGGNVIRSADYSLQSQTTMRAGVYRVEDVQISLASGEVTVRYDDTRTSPSQLKDVGIQCGLPNRQLESDRIIVGHAVRRRSARASITSKASHSCYAD